MMPLGSPKWLPALIGAPVTCHNAHFWSSRHCTGTGLSAEICGSPIGRTGRRRSRAGAIGRY